MRAFAEAWCSLLQILATHMIRIGDKVDLIGPNFAREDLITDSHGQWNKPGAFGWKIPPSLEAAGTAGSQLLLEDLAFFGTEGEQDIDNGGMGKEVRSLLAKSRPETKTRLLQTLTVSLTPNLKVDTFATAEGFEGFPAPPLENYPEQWPLDLPGFDHIVAGAFAQTCGSCGGLLDEDGLCQVCIFLSSIDTGTSQEVGNSYGSSSISGGIQGL